MAESNCCRHSFVTDVQLLHPHLRFSLYMLVTWHLCEWFHIQKVFSLSFFFGKLKLFIDKFYFKMDFYKDLRFNCIFQCSFFSCVKDFKRQPMTRSWSLKQSLTGKQWGFHQGLSLVYPGALLPPCLKTQCISTIKVCSQRRNWS